MKASAVSENTFCLAYNVSHSCPARPKDPTPGIAAVQWSQQEHLGKENRQQRQQCLSVILLMCTLTGLAGTTVTTRTNLRAQHRAPGWSTQAAAVPPQSNVHSRMGKACFLVNLVQQLSRLWRQLVCPNTSALRTYQLLPTVAVQLLMLAGL